MKKIKQLDFIVEEAEIQSEVCLDGIAEGQDKPALIDIERCRRERLLELEKRRKEASKIKCNHCLKYIEETIDIFVCSVTVYNAFCPKCMYGTDGNYETIEEAKQAFERGEIVKFKHADLKGRKIISKSNKE